MATEIKSFQQAVDLTANNQNADLDLRAKAAGENEPKKLYGKTTSEMGWMRWLAGLIGVNWRSDNRETKQKDGATALKQMMDEHYGAAGFGEKVFTTIHDVRSSSMAAKAKKAGKNFDANEMRNINEDVKGVDIKHLKELGDAMIGAENSKKLIAFAKDGTLEAALDEFEKTGSPDHPVTQNDPDTARTVKLMVSQFKDAIDDLKNGTAPKALRKDFQAFFMHVLKETGPRAITAEDVQKHAKTFLDVKTQGKGFDGQMKTVQMNWNRAVGNSNKLKMLEFTGGHQKDIGDLNRYVDNMRNCVDDWFDGLAKDADLGNITAEDRDWLKDQIASLNQDIDRDPKFKKDYDLESDGKHDLADDFMKLRTDFIQDASKMRIGFPEQKLTNSAKFVSGSHVSDRHVANWHDSTFRQLIAERQKWKIENNPKAKRAENNLQKQLSVFPEIKDFASGGMNRGAYENLNPGKVSSVSDLINTWMGEDGILDALDQQYLADDRHQLKDSVYILDAYAEFTQRVDDLKSKYDGDLKNASAQEIYDLQSHAREISDQLDNFDKLIDVINEKLEIDPEVAKTAVKVLDSALTTINDGIADYTKFAEQHQSMKNQRMLQQLPHLQKFRNLVDDPKTPLAAQTTPASLARANGANLDGAKAAYAKSFNAWNQSAAVLNRYADFANQNGDRLIELENMAAGKEKLSKQDGRELHELQSQAKQLSKEITSFSKNTAKLKDEIGVKDKDSALFFDAMEKTASLMEYRLGGGKIERQHAGGVMSSLRSRFKTIEIERHMIHGGGKVDMPTQKDLNKAGASAMNIAKAMPDNAHALNLSKMSAKPLLDAGKHLASYDNRLRSAMRLDPLAERVPAHFKQLVMGFHNEINELDEMHRDLQALRQDLGKDDFMPVVGPVYVPGQDKPIVPNDKKQYLAVLDQFDDQVVKVRDQMIAATTNFAEMQQAGRM